MSVPVSQINETNSVTLKAIEKFLRKRSVTGTLDWSGLLDRDLSTKQKAADVRLAMNKAIGRFLSKVHFDTELGHWGWKGSLDSNGYSRFSFANKYGQQLSISGHRYAYAYFRGTIPKGLHLDHLCGCRDCVNPFHLEAVTLRENSLRQAMWATRKTRRPRCVHGHKFSDYYPWPKKNRTCFTCRQKRYKERLELLKQQIKVGREALKTK